MHLELSYISSSSMYLSTASPKRARVSYIMLNVSMYDMDRVDIEPPARSQTIYENAQLVSLCGGRVAVYDTPQERFGELAAQQRDLNEPTNSEHQRMRVTIVSMKLTRYSRGIGDGGMSAGSGSRGLYSGLSECGAVQLSCVKGGPSRIMARRTSGGSGEANTDDTASYSPSDEPDTDTRSGILSESISLPSSGVAAPSCCVSRPAVTKLSTTVSDSPSNEPDRSRTGGPGCASFAMFEMTGSPRIAAVARCPAESSRRTSVKRIRRTREVHTLHIIESGCVAALW